MSPLEEHEFSYGANDIKQTFFHASGPKDGPLLVFIHGWPIIGKSWKAQLEAFASLGFRCVAPDMPGYGKSTARKVVADYSLEQINLGMLELLKHLNREKAVWIGHDWGCGAVWSFAEHYPERCIGVAGLTVPVRSVELGLSELVRTVDRNLYPEEEYPWGQWSYQRFYETSFEQASQWFEADVAAVYRKFLQPGHPATVRQPAVTANVVKDGGWMGGALKPDPEWRHIPLSALVVDEEMYHEIVTSMEKTGFWGADAWYANHERNKAYYNEKVKNEGYLHMPVLFIAAEYDSICYTGPPSRLAENQRLYCTNLTETSIAAGHWLPQEKPAEVNAAIARWLIESCPQHWPGYWSQGHIKAKC